MIDASSASRTFASAAQTVNGGWIWKGPERPVPYKLPELIASGTAPVLIAGGEKDVDNLRALGFTATCNHGGEGKWWPELTPYLKDRRVFILCDNDEQGEKHQEIVGAALNGVASEIRVVRFPELPAKGDVSDFIEQRRKDGLDDMAIKRNWRSGSARRRRGRRRQSRFRHLTSLLSQRQSGRRPTSQSSRTRT